MNTFQLECFLTVAETLNFVKAAQILNITQPAVTKSIKSLENELNVRLFNRSTRNVELTKEGTLLVSEAKIIIQTSSRAKKRLSSADNTLSLTIGIRLQSQIRLLAGPLKALLKKYEHCCPVFQINTTSTLFRLLNDDQADIILDIETKKTGYDNIVFEPLLEERIFLLCTQKFPLYSRKTVTIEEIRTLDQYPLILLTAPKALNEMSSITMDNIGSRDQAMVHFCQTPEEVCLLAELGCGMAILPELIIPNNPSLHKILISDSKVIPYGTYYKTYNSNELVREFVDILKSTDIRSVV